MRMPAGGSDDARPLIAEIVVVEGHHDKSIVDAAVRATVWVLGGDRLSRRLLDELRRAAVHRGLIVLTDPDGAGERIRRRIDATCPGCKHAHLAKSESIGGGRIGVEHAAPSAVREAIQRARPTVREGADPGTEEFTMADLIAVGLTAHPYAAERREAMGAILGVGYANAKAFLRKLNALGVTRAEWDWACQQVVRDAVEDEGTR